MPVVNPTNRPLASERRMQSTPIGPTGAAIDRPISMPLQKKLGSILAFLKHGWLVKGEAITVYCAKTGVSHHPRATGAGRRRAGDSPPYHCIEVGRAVLSAP